MVCCAFAAFGCSDEPSDNSSSSSGTAASLNQGGGHSGGGGHAAGGSGGTPDLPSLGGGGTGGSAPFDYTLVESDVEGVLAPVGFKVEVFKTGLDRPAWLAFYQDALAVSSDCGSCGLVRLNLEGEQTGETAAIDDPDGIAFDQSGNLYVAGADKVFRATFDAVPPTLLADGFSNLNGVVVGTDGALFVQEEASSIFRMKVDGSDRTVWYEAPGGSGMAPNPEGGVVATGSCIYGDIYRVATKGNAETLVEIPPSDCPTGLSVAPETSKFRPNYVVASLYNTGEVVILDGGDAKAVLKGLTTPAGTATAPDGSFFVTELEKGRILHVFLPEILVH